MKITKLALTIVLTTLIFPFTIKANIQEIQKSEETIEGNFYSADFEYINTTDDTIYLFSCGINGEREETLAIIDNMTKTVLEIDDRTYSSEIPKIQVPTDGKETIDFMELYIAGGSSSIPNQVWGFTVTGEELLGPIGEFEILFLELSSNEGLKVSQTLELIPEREESANTIVQYGCTFLKDLDNPESIFTVLSEPLNLFNKRNTIEVPNEPTPTTSEVPEPTKLVTPDITERQNNQIDNNEREDNANSGVNFYIIGGIGLLLILLVVIFLINKRKK